MLAAMPIVVIVFPGTGIRADVAYKAMQLGIPLGWLLLLCWRQSGSPLRWHGRHERRPNFAEVVRYDLKGT